MDSVFVVIGCSPACFCRNTARAIRLRSIAKSRFSLPFRSSLARGFLAGNPVAASTPCRATALQSSRQPVQLEPRHVAQQLDEAAGLKLRPSACPSPPCRARHRPRRRKGGCPVRSSRCACRPVGRRNSNSFSISTDDGTKSALAPCARGRGANAASARSRCRPHGCRAAPPGPSRGRWGCRSAAAPGTTASGSGRAIRARPSAAAPTLPPCDVTMIILRTPARATLSPISVHTARAVSAV